MCHFRANLTVDAGIHRRRITRPCERLARMPTQASGPPEDVHNPTALHARAILENTDASFKQELSLLNFVFSVVRSHY